MNSFGKIVLAILLTPLFMIILVGLAILSLPFMVVSLSLEVIIGDHELSERVYEITPIVASMNWLERR